MAVLNGLCARECMKCLPEGGLDVRWVFMFRFLGFDSKG